MQQQVRVTLLKRDLYLYNEMSLLSRPSRYFESAGMSFCEWQKRFYRKRGLYYDNCGCFIAEEEHPDVLGATSSNIESGCR